VAALKRIPLILLTLLILAVPALAGDVYYFNAAGQGVDGERCGTKVPTLAEQEANQAAIDAWIKHGGFAMDKAGDVVIPVAIHVVAMDDGSCDVPDAQINDQMDVLNAAYAGTGFSFTLASTDRTYNSKWSTARYGSRQASAMKEATSIDPATTFNIWLANIGGGLLGYATFPDMYPEDSYMHGVVALYSSVPGGTAAPYNEGDTITHEAGHFLGLYHTFQGGCAAPNDYCDDTPQESTPAYGCPEGRDSCTSDPGLDPIHNFMDYSDDYCMYEFTADQTARMHEQMALYRPTMYGGTVVTGPTAAFSGTPVSGDFPLDVQFTDASTGDPTSWSWTFGDGGTSAAQNPNYVYDTVGYYTVSLTVSNVDGSDTLTRTNYINVTDPGGGGDTMYVAAMTATRYVTGRNISGRCTVSLADDGGGAVASATVTVSYTGNNSGTLSGVTGSDGSVTLTTPRVKSSTTEWCFTVTNVTHATLTYDPGANVTTQTCESGDVYREGSKDGLALSNDPNPFNPLTTIRFNLPQAARVSLRIYDVRGHLVATPVDEHRGQGLHVVNWDASDRPSGIYYYQLRAGDVLETRKMMLLK